MRKTALLFPLILLTSACPPTPVPPDTDQCLNAEQNLLKLQCKDSRGELLGGPNKSGVAFHDRCAQTQNAGVALNPTCLSTLTDCKKVDACLQQ